MSKREPLPNQPRPVDLLALATKLRPELHRYWARLMGSVIDGEDVVQDTLERAAAALRGRLVFFPLRHQRPVWLAAAWLEDREVAAVFESRADT